MSSSSSLTTDALSLLHHHRYRRRPPCSEAAVAKFSLISKKPPKFHIYCTQPPIRLSRHFPHSRALSSTDTPVVETSQADDVAFHQKFEIRRAQKVEGKITIRLDSGENEENGQLTVGCSLPGKWVLHWGVTYAGDFGREWDQPPEEMRPSGSIPIKDYAIETPFEEAASLLEGQTYYEVKIDFNTNSSMAAINFVLKDEETGSWYQHKGRDFKVPLIQYLEVDGSVVGAQQGVEKLPESLGQLTSVLLKPEADGAKAEDIKDLKWRKLPLQGFYEEQSVSKETFYDNSVSVSVKHSLENAKIVLNMETDLPGDVVVHWGVYKDDGKTWEIPSEPYPPQTCMFKNKALQTVLQQRDDGHSYGSFMLDEGYVGFIFVLKLKENTWLNNKGNDFCIPFSSLVAADEHVGLTDSQGEVLPKEIDSAALSADKVEASAHTDEIINEIRSLVTDISSEKGRITKSKEAQESILQEIEKLAAEAYSIFRTVMPRYREIDEAETEELEPEIKISSGTGSGFEILCQGFNWESHKSGNWYLELQEKASELSSLGFTVIWLPPPTDSVSPEGYMPRDLYNLNSRYGNLDQLKACVKRLHKVGIRVLGDAVLNHRCAEFQNHNGVWNIFGGRLNWDDRAVVADDPHFQGRGNKSSGDSFHAAPNIDHSQEFVRKDIKEWLCWMREEVGYDGWRLDFVRGFWGGYVKDYLEASEPYFAVGEFWDSLSYTYGEMDHNQDDHRQRIIDWINDTNGTAGAFDVTTKGILHAALDRCEYWRLSDEKGKPPGVMGWWPSRAVTFIENHDTGSTQGHWRFPGGKEMQGYAYILTHPGTPSVFYDHIFSDYQSDIAALISLRKRKKINCRSIVKIVKADRDVYAATIDDKLAMKIGPGHFEPSSGSQKWSVAIEGRDFKVWEAS